MTPAKFITAADVAKSSAFDPDAPAPPRYRPGQPFDALDVRPGRVLLVGAPPGAGKTALVLQVAAGVLQKHSDVQAVVGNVEMAPLDLLARVTARLAGLSIERVADKNLSAPEKERLRKTLVMNQSLLDRMAFLESPFTLDHLAGGLTDFGATLAVVDYVQRFGVARDLRECGSDPRRPRRRPPRLARREARSASGSGAGQRGTDPGAAAG